MSLPLLPGLPGLPGLAATPTKGGGVSPLYLAYDGGDISVYQPLVGSSSLWLEIPMARATDALTRTDVFRWNEGYVCTRSGLSFTRQTQIARQGEQELAIQQLVSAGGAAKSDFAGGSAHGDERLLSEPVITVNGSAFDASGAGTIACSAVSVTSQTEILEVDNATDTRLLEVEKTLTFGGGEILLDLSAEVIQEFYTSLFYIGSYSGLDGVHESARLAPTYAVADLTDGSNMAFSKPDDLVMYGPDYGVKWEPRIGWTKSGRRCRVDENVAGGNPKIYPDWAGSNYTWTIAETLTAQVAYTIGTASAVQDGLP